MNETILPNERRKQELDEIDNRIAWSKGIGIGLGVIGILLAFYPQIFLDIQQICFNEYGDYVGGVSGTILSLGAMSFLYMTFQMQRRQVVMQQWEIDRQRAEKRVGDRKAEIQKAEDWFFSLLTLHNDTVRSLDLRSTKTGNVTHVGKDCFKSMHRKLVKLVTEENSKLLLLNPHDILKQQPFILFDGIVRIYKKDIYVNYENDLDTYFKSLGAILRHVNKFEKELKVDIYPYVETLRSQLSTFELIIIYYFTHLENSDYLAPISKANIRLFKQFDLLQHLQPGKLIPHR